MTIESNQQYLAPEDVAKIMGIKKTLLSNWRVSGGGPSFVKLGTAKGALIRYPLLGANGLIQYIESRTYTHTQARTSDNIDGLKQIKPFPVIIKSRAPRIKTERPIKKKLG